MKLPGSTGWNPENGAVRIIMTGAATDRAGSQAHVYTKTQKKRFKDAADPLKIVIVRDMWLIASTRRPAIRCTSTNSCTGTT